MMFPFEPILKSCIQSYRLDLRDKHDRNIYYMLTLKDSFRWPPVVWIP